MKCEIPFYVLKNMSNKNNDYTSNFCRHTVKMVYSDRSHRVLSEYIFTFL